jgi:hypothetical protein
MPWAVKTKRPSRWGDSPAHHIGRPKSRRRDRTRRQDKDGRGDSASPAVEEAAEVPSAHPRSLRLVRGVSASPDVVGIAGVAPTRPRSRGDHTTTPEQQSLAPYDSLNVGARHCTHQGTHPIRIRNMGADRRTPLYPPQHVSRRNGDRTGRKAHARQATGVAPVNAMMGLCYP